MIKCMLILCFIFVSGSYSALGNELARFKSIEEYKAQLNGVAVFKEDKLDINRDGKNDYLLYSSGGEEVYLVILLASEKDYLQIDIPTAEAYEIVKSNDQNEIKISLGTFPTYGDIHGPDKHYWYDYYIVSGNSINLNNHNHKNFYKKMVGVYKARINELHKEIPVMRNKLRAAGMDKDLIEFRVSSQLDHVIRYREFIIKAEKIVNNNEPNTPLQPTADSGG